MNEEELKKLCKEEFLKNIKENIKSETIFTYVDGLEKENKKQKEVLGKIKEYIKYNACYDKDIKQCCRDLLTDDCDYILELLEEIE